MPTIRLTPAQLAVLQHAAEGKVYRSEQIGSLYESFDRTTNRRVSAIVDRLSDHRQPLIRIGEPVGVIRPWLVTALGREVLAEYDTIEKPYGDCPVCGRSITLRGDGTIRRHGDKKSWPLKDCDGYGQKPKEN